MLNKFLFTVGLIGCLAMSVSAQTFGVQSPGKLTYGSGATMLAGATNGYTLAGVTYTNGLPNTPGTGNLSVPVDGFNWVGLTVGFSGNTAVSTPAGVAVYRSYDYGNNYETTPFCSFTNSPGTGAYIGTLGTNIQQVTTLGFVPYNTSSGIVTNFFVEVKNAPDRVQAQAAGLTRTGPGTPIVVPNAVP